MRSEKQIVLDLIKCKPRDIDETDVALVRAGMAEALKWVQEALNLQHHALCEADSGCWKECSNVRLAEHFRALEEQADGR